MKALVIRYASIGDAIQASSPIAELHDLGYDVHLLTSKEGEETLRHDPNISSFEVVAPTTIDGDYGDWLESISNGYNLICNLTYSVEGELATEPINRNYYLPDQVRRNILGTINYVQRQHKLCQVPFYQNRQWFYETAEEKNEVENSLKDCISVGICLAGSHDFKMWAYLAEFCADLLKRQKVRLILLGGFIARDMAIEKEILNKIEEAFGSLESDEFEIMSMISSPLRTCLTMACHVNILLGPDTGFTNAAAMRPNKKIVYLTHNTPENLTRDWINTKVIRAEAPCSPCVRLRHRDKDCPKVKGKPECIQTIPLTRVMDEIICSVEAVQSRFCEAPRDCQAEPPSHPKRCFERPRRLPVSRDCSNVDFSQA